LSPLQKSGSTVETPDFLSRIEKKSIARRSIDPQAWGMRGPWWWLAVVAFLLRAAAAWGGQLGAGPADPLALVELGVGGEAEALAILHGRRK